VPALNSNIDGKQILKIWDTMDKNSGIFEQEWVKDLLAQPVLGGLDTAYPVLCQNRQKNIIRLADSDSQEG
jgi:hypothetical protein